MTKRKRRVLLVLIAVTCLFMPLSCLPTVVLLNTVNPMALAFITSFSVVNNSGETIYITPIGTYGRDSRKAQLPLCKTKFPYIPALETSRISLKPLETKQIHYDWDDINLSDIVVETEDGDVYQFIVDPNPPTNGIYYAPNTTFFSIPPVAQLQEPDPAVLTAAQPNEEFPRFKRLFLAGLVPPILLLLLVAPFIKELWDKKLSRTFSSANAAAFAQSLRMRDSQLRTGPSWRYRNQGKTSCEEVPPDPEQHS